MNRGFTLIELIVSVGMFVVVVFVAIGALLNLASVNDKSQALLVALENLDFGLENMSRTIRTGYSYTCDPNPNFPYEPNPEPEGTDCEYGLGLHFEDANGDWIMYRLDSDYWGDPGDNIGAVLRRKEVNPPGGDLQNEIAITSSEIDIESLNFIVTGSEPETTDSGGDDLSMQPRVMMQLGGITNLKGLKPDEQAEFNIQTTMTQRRPDRNPAPQD